ncbi:SRPBCC family protein [Brevibacillus agri]|nr:SRPBCC domain-containing protein [Brevibacillus agri]WHX28366.1 SRPBCC domain-containing protein [Brevibacillus agri]
MTASAPEFTIARTLNARRELVWRAWTEKNDLAAWLPSTPLESISFDVREGGRYRYTMVNKQTGQEYHTGGVLCSLTSFLSNGSSSPGVPPMIPSRAPLS